MARRALGKRFVVMFAFVGSDQITRLAHLVFMLRTQVFESSSKQFRVVGFKFVWFYL